MSDLVLYNGAYTGPQVDQAISRALTGGELDKEIEALKAAVGSPLLANTAADMTNINKIYVYVGSEPGYTNGDWYYWNGAAWVSGGQYLSPGYTFDDEPTEGSDNPVKSGGIFDAIEAALGEAMTTALAAYPTDTASGPIATFPDGADNIPVKAMTVDIEPSQDLHGQSAPYPAGGGKNKLTLTSALIKSANSTRTWVGNATTFSGITYTIVEDADGNVTAITASGTASANADLIFGYETVSANMILNGCPSGGSSGTYRLTAAGEGNDTGNGVNVPSTFASSIYIRISNGYAISGTLTFKPMLRLATEADATFAPYSNECPISGWTGANIYDTVGIAIELEQGSVDANGLPDNPPANNRVRMTQRVAVKPSTSYTVLYNDDHSDIQMSVSYYTDSTGNRSSTTGWHNVDYFTTDASTKYALIIWSYTDSSAISPIDVPVVTLYETSALTTYTVDWSGVVPGGVVYGGTLDPLTGTLTVTMASVDLGTLSWTYNSDAVFYATLSSKKRGVSPLICQQYVYRADYGYGVPNMAISDTTSSSILKRIFVKDTRYSDKTTFEAAMNGVQLVYALDSPMTYQLSPTQIATLLGDNNIWADTGDVSVTYRADTGLYIEKKLGA